MSIISDAAGAEEGMRKGIVPKGYPPCNGHSWAWRE